MLTGDEQNRWHASDLWLNRSPSKVGGKSLSSSSPKTVTMPATFLNTKPSGDFERIIALVEDFTTDDLTRKAGP